MTSLDPKSWNWVLNAKSQRWFIHPPSVQHRVDLRSSTRSRAAACMTRATVAKASSRKQPVAVDKLAQHLTKVDDPSVPTWPYNMSISFLNQHPWTYIGIIKMQCTFIYRFYMIVLNCHKHSRKEQRYVSKCLGRWRKVSSVGTHRTNEMSRLPVPV